MESLKNALTLGPDKAKTSDQKKNASVDHKGTKNQTRNRTVPRNTEKEESSDHSSSSSYIDEADNSSVNDDSFQSRANKSKMLKKPTQ